MIDHLIDLVTKDYVSQKVCILYNVDLIQVNVFTKLPNINIRTVLYDGYLPLITIKIGCMTFTTYQGKCTTSSVYKEYNDNNDIGSMNIVNLNDIDLNRDYILISGNDKYFKFKIYNAWVR